MERINSTVREEEEEEIYSASINSLECVPRVLKLKKERKEEKEEHRCNCFSAMDIHLKSPSIVNQAETDLFPFSTFFSSPRLLLLV